MTWADDVVCFMARCGGWQARCRVCGERIDAGEPTPYCSPSCAERDPDFHGDHHYKPEHNSDGWTWCDTCGGWVIVHV